MRGRGPIKDKTGLLKIPNGITSRTNHLEGPARRTSLSYQFQLFEDLTFSLYNFAASNSRIDLSIAKNATNALFSSGDLGKEKNKATKWS